MSSQLQPGFSLHWKAEHGHEAAVKRLLANEQVDVNLSDELRRTPLLLAAKNGHKEVTQLLLADDRVDVNRKGFWGSTPLSLAAENGHKAVVQLLLADNRVDVNAMDMLCKTPLSSAAANGHTTVVQLLLADDRVDVIAMDAWSGQTPILGAARNGYKAVVQLLLADDQVDVNAKDFNGWTPLLWAARNGHNKVVQPLLANNQLYINAEDSSGQTSLSLAAERGNNVLVRLLLANDRVDVNAESLNGRTPLSLAAENGHKAVVQLLLANHQVDVNAKDSNGQTPLLWAAQNGHEAVAKLLFHRRQKDTPPETPTYLSMIWHIILFLMFLARRLQTMLQTELFSHHLSGFPNRLRPPCTTMPWNIRPALFVLWGVCWMFYSSQDSPPQHQSIETWYNELLNTELGISLHDIPYDPNQSQYATSFDQQLESLQRGTPADSLPIALPFGPWAIPDPQNTWINLFLEGQNDFGQEVGVSDSSALQPSESSKQTNLQPPVPAADTIQNELNGYEPLDTIQPVDPNGLLQANMPASNHHLAQSDPIIALPTTEVVGDQVVPAVAISPTSIHTDQSAEPPRNSKGNIICDRVGCGSVTFPRKSAWRIHMDRHNRPYKCESANCPHTGGFGSKGELKRHITSKHTSKDEQPKFICPVTDCSYSCARKDHLRDHTNRQHKECTPEEPATRDENRNSPAGIQNIPDPAPSSRASPADQVDVTVRSARKRRRMPDRSLSPENTDSANVDLHELREENKRLRRENADLMRKLESYKETLFDVIRKDTQ